MSTGIDLRHVQESYQRMTDEELVRTATQDGGGLTPEAMEIVKAEIKKRGLNQNIANGIDAQNKTYTSLDIDAYCDIISKLPCPYCGGSAERLNATVAGEVTSYIFFTQYARKIKIGCPDCLDKANDKALTKTALLGWWGIPWGIIRTVQSIALNIKRKRLNHSNEHTDYLRNFALSTIGELETYKDNKEKLQEIVARQNH